MVTTTVRFASLNLWCFGTPEHWRAQEAVLRGDTFELVALQEVTRAKARRFAETGGFDWWRCSLGDSVRDARLGVAVLGKNLPEPVAAHQLRRRRSSTTTSTRTWPGGSTSGT